MTKQRRLSNGRIQRLLVLGLMMLLPRLGSGASPLSGQQTGERLDRRKGDRQLQARLETSRLHEEMRSEMMQPQVRPTLRTREWQDDLVPRPRRADDLRDRRRRVGITLD